MICRGCGNQSHRTMTKVSESGQLAECCDQCSRGTFNAGLPDVHWSGHPHYEEFITDNMGSPIYLKSRRHKAEVMRSLEMREAGDRVGGKR